jgi:hypothetical protein
MFGNPSITTKLSGACLAVLLCCSGCQFNNMGTNSLTSATAPESLDLFPLGSLFKPTQDETVINPYAEQQRQQDFSDDRTRPSVDMTKFQPKAKRGFSLFGD